MSIPFPISGSDTPASSPDAKISFGLTEDRSIVFGFATSSPATLLVGQTVKMFR